MSPAATPYEVGGVRYIPLTYDSQDSQSSALKLILTLVPEWGHGDSHVEFVRFTDGITNTLLKAVNRRPGLSKAEVDKDAILLRAYGNGTDILIDREREAANHEVLMRHHLAPELLARFGNGMLYRYVPGEVAQPPHLSEPPLSKAIARRLAEWHATVPCQHNVPPHVNGKTNGNHRNEARNQNGNHDHAPASGKPTPNVWTTMQKWILALPAQTDQQKETQATLQQELTEMVGKLSHRPGLGQNGLVFAHCDLLSANIIIHRDESEPTVSFIDYEYATPSPAAFDVANHFAEWGGFECDYTALPTISQRRAFIREYIKTYAELSDEHLDLEEDTRKLEDEVNVFRGVPGFYWGLWAAIQATISDIDFDYARYSELRLGEYRAVKEEESGHRKAQGLEKPLREKIWWQE